MKQTIISVLALIGALAILGGVFVMWQKRPSRPAIIVNGRVLTVGELDMRGRMLLVDARESEHIYIPESREKEALAHYTRRAAKLWIMKEVLLAEAVAQGLKATEEDEKAEIKKAEENLKKYKKMTLDEYFAMGPLSAEVKHNDFREGILIGKFVEKMAKARIKPLTPVEIDKRLVELRKRELMKPKEKGKDPVKINRKMAGESLQREHYNEMFRLLFRECYGKVSVKVPLYPEMETVDGVSPDRK